MPKIKQIFMVVGFMLIVLGNIINLFEEEEIYINAFTIENISAMLSVVFVSLEKKSSYILDMV